MTGLGIQGTVFGGPDDGAPKKHRLRDGVVHNVEITHEDGITYLLRKETVTKEGGSPTLVIYFVHPDAQNLFNEGA